MATKRRFVRPTSRCTDRSRWKEWLRQGVCVCVFHTSYKYSYNKCYRYHEWPRKERRKKIRREKGILLTVLLDIYLTLFVLNCSNSSFCFAFSTTVNISATTTTATSLKFCAGSKSTIKMKIKMKNIYNGSLHYCASWQKIRVWTIPWTLPIWG